MSDIKITSLENYCRECRKPCEVLGYEWEVGELLHWESDSLVCGPCAAVLAVKNMDKACGVIR